MQATWKTERTRSRIWVDRTSVIRARRLRRTKMCLLGLIWRILKIALLSLLTCRKNLAIKVTRARSTSQIETKAHLTAKGPQTKLMSLNNRCQLLVFRMKMKYRNNNITSSASVNCQALVFSKTPTKYQRHHHCLLLTKLTSWRRFNKMKGSSIRGRNPPLLRNSRISASQRISRGLRF